MVDELEVVSLLSSIRKCVEEADSLTQFMDDADAELFIFYDSGRTEKMPRGLGNDNFCIGDIMYEFLSNYFDKG